MDARVFIVTPESVSDFEDSNCGRLVTTLKYDAPGGILIASTVTGSLPTR
jgi:hypothetical protein